MKTQDRWQGDRVTVTEVCKGKCHGMTDKGWQGTGLPALCLDCSQDEGPVPTNTCARSNTRGRGKDRVVS